MGNKISRRNFLRSAALGGAGFAALSALTGCSGAASSSVAASSAAAGLYTPRHLHGVCQGHWQRKGHHDL